MKRPHRSIETFDISLMAVVTKAMGAFLVLMLLLMPYYSSSPLGKDEAEDLARKVQDADQKIKGVLDKLGDKDLGKDLVSAREELGSGAQLINQLKRYVDQLSAQVTRLEERIVTLTAELDQLKKDKTTLTARVAELEKQNSELKAENEKLKAEIEQLKKRIAELEKLVEEQKKRIAELEKKIEELNKELAELRKLEPERVEELKKQIEELKKEIARLKQQIDDLNGQVAALQDENARLRARIAELEQENVRLNAMVVPLQQENTQQKSRIAELEALLAQLRQDNTKLEAQPVLAADAQSGDCSNFKVSAFNSTAKLTEKYSKYGKSLFNFLEIGSNGSAFGVSRVAGRYVSTFIISPVSLGRYFLILTSRVEEKSASEGEKQPSHDGEGQQGQDGQGKPAPEVKRLSPLLPIPKSCKAIVTVIYSRNQSVSRRTWAVDFIQGRPVQYFADAILGGDWSFDFVDPTPEGEAWLKDQLADAEIAPGVGPQAAPEAGGAPQAVPPERLQRAAPDRERPPPRVPGERRRGVP